MRDSLTYLRLVTAAAAACRWPTAASSSSTARRIRDPHVEAIRRLLVNAEVLQAVMRVRPYDRTDANPVDIYLFSDIDVGLPVHSLVRWVDFSETETEMMAAEGGVVFPKAATAMRAFPDVFGNVKERRVRQMLAAQIGGSSFLRTGSKLSSGLLGVQPTGGPPMPSRLSLGRHESDAGELIATRLGCAIEWRGGQGADWQCAEPQTAGIQDGVQSLAGKVEDLSTRDVPELQQVVAVAKRPPSTDQNAAA